jgi:hypothetical protein
VDIATPPAAFPRFGYTVALAERTLTVTLRRHLAERNVKPETWYALRLIAGGGPALAREALSRDLESSRTMNADSTHELLARLEAEGLIRGDREVDLTDEGETLYRSVRDYIAGPTAELLGRVRRRQHSDDHPHPAGDRRARSRRACRRQLRNAQARQQPQEAPRWARSS